MSRWWTPGVGVTTSIGLHVGHKEPVTLLASRGQGDVCLTIGDSDAEIRLERPHVEALRDQIPAALAGLDQFDVDNAACDKASEAGQRATGAAARAREAADEAELMGDFGRMSALLAAAEQAEAAAGAVDAIIAAVDDAAITADNAAEYALDLAAGRTLGSEPAGPGGS